MASIPVALLVLRTVASLASPEVALPIFVSPAWLAERRAEFQVVFTGWGPLLAESAVSVVPGAIYINTDELEYDVFAESSQDAAAREAKGIPEGAVLPQNFWRLYPDEYLLPALAFAGVGSESRVAVYGKDVMAASRVAFAMLKAGVSDVRVLNGGVEAWQSEGRNVADAPVARMPIASFGATKSLRPQLSADPREVRRLARTALSGAVGDVRTRCEFDGTCAPYDYVDTVGRVTGAVWADGGHTDPYHMEPYMLPSGQLRPLADVAALWASLGVCQHGGDCAFYCGTGWRSALATLVALDLGMNNQSANLDGGWYVYSCGPDAGQDPTIAPQIV